MTRDLFDMIVELRISETALGLAKHIEREFSNILFKKLIVLTVVTSLRTSSPPLFPKEGRIPRLHKSDTYHNERTAAT